MSIQQLFPTSVYIDVDKRKSTSYRLTRVVETIYAKFSNVQCHGRAQVMSKKWSSFSKGTEVSYGSTPCKLGTVGAETGGSQFESLCNENLSQKQGGRGTNRRVQSKYPNIRQDKTPATRQV